MAGHAMPLGWGALLLLVLPYLLGLQVIIFWTVFLILGSYNKGIAKSLKAFESAPRGNSLFELRAFSGDAAKCPFVNTTWRLTIYERWKLALVASTLFPFRVVGFVAAFVGAFLVTFVLLTLGLKPLVGPICSVSARIILFCFGYVWIRVKGRQAPNVGAIVSNHCTLLDGLVWLSVSRPRIFAEKSNFKPFMLKVFADGLDIVLFDRGGQESRQAAKRAMAVAARQAVKGDSNPILVFPSGTTTNMEVVITFKDGAFATGLPVQPAILRYHFRHCDPSWVFSGPGTLMLIFRMMCQVVNYLDVEFLPVCEPTEEEKLEPHDFARRAQLMVAEALKVPVTEHAVEDVQLQLAAVKVNLPPETGVVGFPALKDMFSVDTTQIKQQLFVFRQMDQDGDGIVDFDGFIDCFRRGFHEPSAEQTRLLREFFRLLTGGREGLDFRTFLVGLALVNEAERDEDSNATPSTRMPLEEMRRVIYAQLAFAAFASEADDRISWREFEELWKWLRPQYEIGDSPMRRNSALRSQNEGGDGHQSWFSGLRSRKQTNEPLVPDAREIEAQTSLITSARAAFDAIGGINAEVVTWAQFSEYALSHPEFEKRLRQAFFSRVAADFGSAR